MLAPGVAGADDGGYVELLDAGNVPYDTPAGAVLMGRAVCSSLESGGTVEHNEHRSWWAARVWAKPTGRRSRPTGSLQLP
jgi:Protein of unknown function (DUF732)